MASARTRNVSASTSPDTSASPSPRTADTTVVSRSPVTGSAENATPDAPASTSAWRITAMGGGATAPA